MSEKIHVLVVDDHPIFRDGVVRTLVENEIEVVGQATTAEEAIHMMHTNQADILLLDIGIPGGGILCAINVLAAYPQTKIVMLTGSDNEGDLLAALKAGARGYVLKGVSAHELIRIIRNVAAGDIYVDPSMATHLLFDKFGAQTNTDQARRLLDGLNERERQILDLVAAGQSNREIGQKLYLSENTVKQYMTNILEKLQVRNRVEAALLVLRKDTSK